MTTTSEEIELATGSSEEMIELFEARDWGDGLPLVPPTKQRVDEMLRSGVVGDPPEPDEVIATLEPRLGEATRRTIAINAVLAGCPAGVLPL